MSCKLADALGTAATALLDDEAPDQQAYLEIELSARPAYQALGLGHLKPAKVPDNLDLLTMWHTVRDRPSGGQRSRSRRAGTPPTMPCAAKNYFPEIEALQIGLLLQLATAARSDQ